MATDKESSLSDAPDHRSGFAALIGRPNVGKSTLLNQILRAKVSITSSRPQTTRNAVRGVLNRDGCQVVFVDTPGFHKPRTALGSSLNGVVRATLSEVDAVIFVLDGSQPIGRGDAFIAGQLAKIATAVLAVVNKVDLIDDAHRRAQLEVAAHLGRFVGPLAVSARTGEGVKPLVDEVARRMPAGPQYYPDGMLTDQPEATLVAELVREKALELLSEEVPHSVAVVVEEMRPGKGHVVEVDALLFVERESQKGIVIGKGGRLLKQIGSRARKEIEALLGSRVYLSLRVKVRRDWQERPDLLQRFGYGR